MISISGLTKTYGKLVAVRDISLEIRAGETFAFLGPNGSGKTTTLKCLVGLARPTAGEILVGGFNLRRDSIEARRQMSYLPQRVSFHDNLTAREVLEFYGRLRKLPRRQIEEALAAGGFNSNGFMDSDVGTLSGGMLQRLGLAVACLPDTPILVLDEPMVNLDPQGAINFREFLVRMKGKNKTTIFSSHILADVEHLADRVAILVGGRLVALESVGALREGVLRSSKMRLSLANPDSRWEAVARAAGADTVAAEGNSLVIESPPEKRLPILRTLEGGGAKIAKFSTIEPSLEDIYLRYIHEEDGHARGNPSGRVRPDQD